MSDDFEVRDENGEVLEILTEEEQENTEGGALITSATSTKNNSICMVVDYGTISYVKVLSNQVGGSYSFTPTALTIRRTPGKKGIFKVSFGFAGSSRTRTLTVKFI